MDQAEVWEGIADGWKEVRRTPKKEVVEFLSGKKGIILDVGCGSGRNFISGRGRKYFGVDLSGNMLRFAKENAIQRKINMAAARASATSLPVRSGAFSTVLYVAVLHTIKGAANRKKSLLEIRRTMRDGGRAIITVWNRKQPRFSGIKKSSYIPWRHGGKTFLRYYYLYDKSEIGALLKSTGFKVEKMFLSDSVAFGIFPRDIIAVVRK